MHRALLMVEQIILRQRGHLFPWVPVCLGTGIGLYFVLKVEPAMTVHIGLAGFGVAGLILRYWLREGLAYAVILMSLIAIGFAAAGIRAHSVGGPTVDFRYYGAVEGRIVGIDRSASDAVRLTLDHVVLERMAPLDTPHKVRVSLHGQQGYAPLLPGTTVILTGHLSRANGPVEPGGFDFRRHAWFRGLGAVGYTRTPVLVLEPPQRGLHVFKARMWLSARVQDKLGGEAGAFAAAVMSGDRSGMGQATLKALRDTNLAHLLAISGLHMGLLAGFVFGALRLSLLLLPLTRHRWPNKQVAAIGALLAAMAYLALSGGNVATERAFVMVAVSLCAILVNRRALSLRAVALAATIVLLWQPEALLGPGFQMSFSATVALVAVFEQVSIYQQTHRPPRWIAPVLALVVSSAVAGLATAPFAMMHFNRFAQFGLIANLLSVPIMGMIIVPMAVVAALLMPFGLDALPLAVMGAGLSWVLGVANEVAQWSGAVAYVKVPGAAVLPLIAIGGLTLCLWRGKGRLVGVAPVALAGVLWMGAERPDMLISQTGGLVGVMSDGTRAVSRAKGEGFTASVWLENDGAGLTQFDAAQNWSEGGAEPYSVTRYAGIDLITLRGKTGLKSFKGCAQGQILVSNTALDKAPDCLSFDPKSLKETGSVAINFDAEGIKIKTTADVTGRRLWSH